MKTVLATLFVLLLSAYCIYAQVPTPSATPSTTPSTVPSPTPETTTNALNLPAIPDTASSRIPLAPFTEKEDVPETTLSPEALRISSTSNNIAENAAMKQAALEDQRKHLRRHSQDLDSTVVNSPKFASHGIQCTLCSLVVADILNLVDETSPVETLDVVLRNVCLKMPPNWRGACQAVIAAIQPSYAELVPKNLSPHKFCEKANVCNPEIFEKAKGLFFGNLDCMACRRFVGDNKEYIKSGNENSSVFVPCANMPFVLQPLCTVLEAKYTEIYRNVMEEKSPEVVCAIVQLCH